MERETGFEPATSTLARSHSTTELFPPTRLTRSTVPHALSRFKTGPFRYLMPKAFSITSRTGSLPGVNTTPTTSKRQGGSGLERPNRKLRAMLMSRRCFVMLTAAAGPPKPALRRVLTSTNTSVTSSRATTSISPHRVRYRAGKNCVPATTRLSAGQVFSVFAKCQACMGHGRALGVRKSGTWDKPPRETWVT
jgi:hypothetical protein